MKSYSINDLSFQKVCFSYDDKLNTNEILNNFSYKIKKGKFTSIIGPSGSGKTSLLKLISGITKCKKGEIRFENKIIKNKSIDISLVQQSAALMPWLNVYQNIELGNINKRNEVDDLFFQSYSCRKIQRTLFFKDHFYSFKLLFQASPSSEDFFTDQWINFDEFCQGVASFYSPTTVMMMSQSQPPLPRGRYIIESELTNQNSHF